MEIINKKRKLLIVFVVILCLMYIFAVSGLMFHTDDALAQYGKELAGYKERIYNVKMGESGIEVFPIIGAEGVIQPIAVDEEILSNDTLMLGLYMATYARENTGRLCVEISQGDESQTYEIDMGEVEDNTEMKLLFSTQNFRVGEINVRVYSPDGNGENCVALYAVDNLETYEEIIINGEKTDKNAVIQLYVPSKYATSKFKMI